MKYKLGDRVKVHSKEWFDNNCDRNDFFNTYGSTSRKGSNSFVPDMQKLCGKIVTIKNVRSFAKSYSIREDSGRWNWEDWMFEDWMFEDTKTNNTDTIYNPNIVEDFAKLIGVELDEEFYDNRGSCRYKFTADSGLMIYDDAIENWRIVAYSLTIFFNMIKEGKFIKKWTPKVGETVYIPYFGSTRPDYYEVMDYRDNGWQESLYRAGLMFKTSEEAIHFVQKLISDRKEEFKNE